MSGGGSRKRGNFRNGHARETRVTALYRSKPDRHRTRRFEWTKWTKHRYPLSINQAKVAAGGGALPLLSIERDRDACACRWGIEASPQAHDPKDRRGQCITLKSIASNAELDVIRATFHEVLCQLLHR